MIFDKLVADQFAIRHFKLILKISQLISIVAAKAGMRIFAMRNLCIKFEHKQFSLFFHQKRMPTATTTTPAAIFKGKNKQNSDDEPI